MSERFAFTQSKTKVGCRESRFGRECFWVEKQNYIQCSSDFNAPLTRHCSLGQKNAMRTFHTKHFEIITFLRTSICIRNDKRNLIFFVSLLWPGLCCVYNPDSCYYFCIVLMVLEQELELHRTSKDVNMLVWRTA